MADPLKTRPDFGDEPPARTLVRSALTESTTLPTASELAFKTGLPIWICSRELALHTYLEGRSQTEYSIGSSDSPVQRDLPYRR